MKGKYGKPYGRKHLLRHGAVKEISEKTGYHRVTITQQLNGDRTISPIVKALADKYADETQAVIDEIQTQ